MDLYAVRQKLNLGISLNAMNLKVTYYSRVSTLHEQQKSSLKNQIEHFDEMIKAMMGYLHGLEEALLTFDDKRINLLGISEMAMFQRLEPEARRTAIDSFFTVDGKGNPVRLISCDSFMYRATLEVYENGTIEYSGSSGATTMNYDYYTLPKSAAKLKNTVSLGTHSSEEDFDTIIYEYNGDEVSEKEYNQLLNEQQDQKLMDIDWKKK